MQTSNDENSRNIDRLVKLVHELKVEDLKNHKMKIALQKEEKGIVMTSEEREDMIREDLDDTGNGELLCGLGG